MAAPPPPPPPRLVQRALPASATASAYTAPDHAPGEQWPGAQRPTRQQTLDYFDNTWALTELLFSALRDECREVQRGINEIAGEFRACDAGIREGAALCGPRIRCVRAAVPDSGGAAATAVTEQQQL